MNKQFNTLENGSCIGHYEIVEQIGEGATARIFRVVDQRLGRELALKVLRPQYASDSVIRERFFREGRMMATLSHPAILEIYDVGEDDGHHYICMPCMSGGNLSERITRGTLDEDEIVRIVEQVACALDVAHAEGIIHRDIKPANILFDEAGTVFLTDFGIGKHAEIDQNITIPTALIGTPPYMSPEQVQGDLEIDGRSDLYALGVVLYEMLTGEPPFKAGSGVDTAKMHLFDPVPALPPHLAERWQTIVDRALAKKPDQRFQTGEAFYSALLVKPDPQPAKRKPVISSSPVRHNLRRYLAVGAVSVVAMVIGLGYMLSQVGDEKKGVVLAEGEVGMISAELAFVSPIPEEVEDVPVTKHNPKQEPLSIPSLITANHFTLQQGVNEEEVGNLVGYINDGDFVEYEVLVEKDDVFSAVFQVSSLNGGGRFELIVDDQYITTIQVPSTGGWNNWETINLDNISLEAGKHTMRLAFEAESNQYLLNLHSIEFQTSNQSAVDPVANTAQTQLPKETDSQSDLEKADPTPFTIPGGINAGDFSTQKGIEVKSGNVGAVNHNDFVEYDIFVSTTNIYDAKFRVASNINSGRFNLLINDQNIATAQVANTGGWQEWDIVRIDNLELEAGRQKLRLEFEGNGDGNLLNLDWLAIQLSAKKPYAINRIMGANQLFTQNGLQIIEEDYSVGFINNGDSATYLLDILETGKYQFDLQASSATDGGIIKLINQEVVLAEITVPNTGGWQEWQTFTIDSLPLEKGTQELRFEFEGGEKHLFNLRLFVLKPLK